MNEPGILLKLRIDFQNDVVLVELGVDGRDLALSECVVESVVDLLRQNAQAGRGVAINHYVRLKASGLLIAGYIAKLRQSAQLV